MLPIALLTISKASRISEPPQSAVPEERAGQLHQAQVVLGVLVVSHQHGPQLREPGERPLHDPAPRLGGAAWAELWSGHYGEHIASKNRRQGPDEESTIDEESGDLSRPN